MSDKTNTRNHKNYSQRDFCTNLAVSHKINIRISELIEKYEEQYFFCIYVCIDYNKTICYNFTQSEK